MSIYAEVIDGIVVNVIVADENFIKTQTEKNYIICQSAGIGWSYDNKTKKFTAPKPFESWILNSSNEWEAPKPYPIDGSRYYWNEDAQEWIKENE